MRLPPHSPADERGLIAALVNEPNELIGPCLEAGINPESFTGHAARRVFELVLGSHSAGKTLTIEVALQESMLTLQEFAAVTDNPPISLGWKSHIEAVANAHRRRKVIRAAEELIEAAHAEPDNIAGCVSRVLMTQTQQGNAKPWSEVVNDSVLKAEAIARGEALPEQDEIPWPWTDCDRFFHRFKRRELVIVAARPSVGKSSLMRSIAYHSAKLGYNVLIESIEDSASNISESMAATNSGIGKTKFPKAHASDQRDYIAAMAALKLPTLHVFDSDRSIASITARARAIHAQNPLDMICVDYLGQIIECRNGTGTANKASAIGNVTKALKDLAADLNCVVICLAQFNRENAKDNREPQLHELKDSGDIEQDCDRAIFIHRPDEDPISRTPQSVNDSEQDCPRFFQSLIQAKGRNVGTGIVSVYFNRAITRFTQITK